MYEGSDGTEYIMRSYPMQNGVEVRINYADSDRDDEIIYPHVFQDEKFFSFSQSILIPANIEDINKWRMDNISCNKDKKETMGDKELYQVSCLVDGEENASRYSYLTDRGVTSINFSFLKGVKGGDIKLKSREGLARLCSVR